jgi:predicted PurR-regulated permease PerM
MKTKHLSEAAKFLIIAATILIVCALVVVAFIVMKEGKTGANKSISQYNTITNQVSDINREIYNGLLVSGEEVRNLIADVLDKEDIKVDYITLDKKAAVTTATSTTLTLERKEPLYINPTGLFIGKALTDENGVLNKLLFTQRKY